MAGNYWDNYWRERRSRRRFLGGAVAAGAGASAFALVGCGDDDDDDDDDVQLATPTAGANATPTPVDPLAGAKRGGVLKLDQTGDPPTLDPYGNISFLTKGNAAAHYSRLYMYKAGPGIAYGSVRPTPDAAESAEASPDGLTWTVKLRPNVKFHNIAPVNGRTMTTEDVKASWERANSATSTNKPSAAMPVDKVEYPDATTIRFTMSKPSAVFLDVLADTNIFYLMPKEAFATSGGFDPAKISIGSGPWVWKDYTPSVSFVRTRHADWHLGGGATGAPFFDSVEYAIIPEYPNRLAQFLAGNTDISGINAEDLPNVVKQLPNARIEARTGPTLSFTFFGPEDLTTWAKDPRVRQAISMSYNRDELMELGYNVKKLRDAGLKVETPWHNLLPAGETAWWIDPKSADQGASSKFFTQNLTEAKALLSAAGFANGVDAGTYQYTANRYGKLFNDIAEANIGYQTAIGVKTVTDVQDYSSKYITQTFLGNFKGIAFGYETPFPEAGSYLTRFFTDNPTNHSKINDPVMTKLANDISTELNEEKRKALFKEAQIKNAENMYYIPNVAGAGTGWAAGAANIRNWPEFVTKAYGLPSEVLPFLWRA